MSNEDAKNPSKQSSNSSPDKDMQDSESVHSKGLSKESLDSPPKTKKATIMRLNSLSNLLGSLGLDNIPHVYQGAPAEIIFHSPF
jgi:hypothetical protein